MSQKCANVIQNLGYKIHFQTPSQTNANFCVQKNNSLGSIILKHTFPTSSEGIGTVDSVSVCQAGHPGLCPARPTCFIKVEFYQNAIDMFPPVLTTGSTKAVHVLSCLCDNACKRSLAICRKSRAPYPVSRLLSVPIWPACAEQGC